MHKRFWLWALVVAKKLSRFIHSDVIRQTSFFSWKGFSLSGMIHMLWMWESLTWKVHACMNENRNLCNKILNKFEKIFLRHQQNQQKSFLVHFSRARLDISRSMRKVLCKASFMWRKEPNGPELVEQLWEILKFSPIARKLEKATKFQRFWWRKDLNFRSEKKEKYTRNDKRNLKENCKKTF